MLKGEGAECTPPSFKGTFGGVIPSPEASSEGRSRSATLPKPPSWKHVNRNHSPHLRKSPSPWGGALLGTFLFPVSNCFYKLDHEKNKSIAYLFQIASGTGLGAFLSRLAQPERGLK